jgi:hypothetical protein
MTHDQYLSRLERFTDSGEDAGEVLRHAGACAACRKERRLVERGLARLDPGRRSIAEEIFRFGATAALLAIVALGVQRVSVRSDGSPSEQPAARYRIVGNASGVVAYTPGGVVVGVAGPSDAGKGVSR